MNVGEVKNAVKVTFGDNAGVQIVDADILDWINRGQRHIVTVNPELLEKSAKANSVANQQDYTFPADLLNIRSLYFKSEGATSYIRLEGKSIQEFDVYADGWDGTQIGKGTPAIYATFENTFKLFPIPTTSITDAIKIFYYRKPTDRVNDADVIDLPIGYHEAIVAFCLTQAYEMDEDWTSVSNKASELATRIASQKLKEKDHNQEYYPRITVLEDDAW